jgi:hypothetical protein|tara:strand:- start:8209 stop:8634 length:426 start_codon:yes stop_codon:yes gene_type:complete
MAFKIEYTPHVMMTIKADTITKLRVDYRLNQSQSHYFEEKLWQSGNVSYDTNLNYNTQTSDTLYDWACKPLSGSLLPTFITDKLGKTHSSISVTTGSFTDSEYWGENESLNNMPTMSFTPYTGMYGFSWTSKYKAVIEVEE